MKYVVIILILLFPFFGFNQTQIYDCVGQTKETQGGIITTAGNENPQVVPLLATEKIRYEVNPMDSSIYIQTDSSLSFVSELSGTYTYKKDPFTFRDTDGKLKTAYLTYPNNKLRNDFSTILITVEPNKVVIYGTDKKKESFEIHTPIFKQWEVADLSHLKIEMDSIQDVQPDCTFDTKNQTDEFLKGIDFFKGYVWNDSTKTATLTLSTGEILSIKRGGCNHYSVIAEVRLDLSTNLYPIQHHFHYFYEIASKLKEDFMHDSVVPELKSKNYDIMEFEDYSRLTFKSQYLQDNRYFISKSAEDNNIVFSFGWRM